MLAEPAGHHVGVADGLDLLQPVPLGELVEVREHLVQIAHHQARRHLLRQPREVDDVGEHHGHVGEAVGDDAVLLLQPLRDRAGQDVEQQPLGLLLLVLQQLVLLVDPRCELVALADEVADEEVDDGRHRGEVEREEHRDALHRHARVDALGEVVVEEPGHRGHHDVGEEPRHRLARPLEDHDPDRREQRPQHHARGADVAADAPLHDERHEQEQQRLDEAVERKVAVHPRTSGMFVRAR